MASSPSSGFNAPSPAPSAPVYPAYPAPTSSPFALRSFPVPMEASYFKRYYYKGSYVPFLEDFAHEFKDVARNKKEHYYAIINHPKLEANLSAFLNSRDGGTLYFGIHDSGQVIGVSITRDQLDTLKNQIWAKMETFNPVPDPHLYRIEIVPVCNARGTALIKDLYVVEIHVTGGTRLYFNREDRAWVRRDAGNHCLKSGAEVRDFIEQRAKERRQEKRGEKRRPDHHHHESSSSIEMDTNRDDELRGTGTPTDSMTMRPVTPRDRRARTHSVSSTAEAMPASTPLATTTALAQSTTSVPLLFPLRRPVHRDGRVAPVWLKSWSSSDPTPDGGIHDQTAPEEAGDGHSEVNEAQWTVVSKKRKPTPADPAPEQGLSDSDAPTCQPTQQDDAAETTQAEDPAPPEEKDKDDVEERKEETPTPTPTPTSAEVVDDPPLRDAIPEVVADGGDEDARQDAKGDCESSDTTESRPTLNDEAEEKHWAKEMRDLEEDLERLSAETNALVSLSWPAEANNSNNNDDETNKAGGALLLQPSSVSSSELKEKADSDLEPREDKEEEEGDGEETILHPPFKVTAKTNTTSAATSFHGALPPFSFADFSSSFFSTFSLPSSLYSPSSSSSSSSIPTLSSSSSSSSSASATSASYSSPSSSSSSPAAPALHPASHGTRSSPASSPSASTRSLAAFLPATRAASSPLGSPHRSPLIATAARDAHDDDGSPADAVEAAQERKVGKNRRKKEQRMKASTGGDGGGVTPASATTSTSTATAEDSTPSHRATEEAAMEAELDKLERELEEDRRQLVSQFASCFAELALSGGSSSSSSSSSSSDAQQSPQ